MKKWWNKLRNIGLPLRTLLISRPTRNQGQESRGLSAPSASSPEEEAAYQAIHWYGRRKLRREIAAVHRRLITDQPEGSLARQLRRVFR
ncbi:MAG: hypothetical protein KDC66_04015 [Phaeodactylibacter sp.]|nr:hypothetical protein [Phaeodactylibacter sp.]MCB9272452.1 hypothetical protein [Lewinellaceae bacterium]